MDYKELYEKYQALLTENNSMKEELRSLRARLGILECQVISSHEVFVTAPEPEMPCSESENCDTLRSGISNTSDSMDKIKLFMSLFRGRDDVYAKRWENPKKGTAGYSPVCANEWKFGTCQKAKTKCANCTYKNYLAINEKIIDDHLRSRNNFVAGIYPMCTDETCYFLAIDFDDGEWQKDVTTLREICKEFKIPIAVERSRSGKGAHVWFFFESALSAAFARKFGSALLSYAMNKRHEIPFNSYDRFFPNQDTMPKGGFGNLIALPLQKAARCNNNSVFIDENFKPYDDQWAFLSSILKLSEDNIELLITKLCHGNELGVLRKDEEEAQKPGMLGRAVSSAHDQPWETNRIKLTRDDFPREIEIVKANMLFVPKAEFSQRSLNYLKRLAAFKNPEFYKAQAMRIPIKKMQRIISCSDETAEYLCLPRGCENELKDIFKEQDRIVHFVDKTNWGRSIDVEFNGSLRDDQPQAIEKLLKFDNGILSGTTAFGKTVVAIKLIAERKVNTLILVDKVSLVAQWRKRLTDFLIINESLPEAEEAKKRGRKKARSIIGQLGAGKNSLSGIIDIAVMQSLNRMGEVKASI